jgi:hypothetical protein
MGLLPFLASHIYTLYKSWSDLRSLLAPATVHELFSSLLLQLAPNTVFKIDRLIRLSNFFSPNGVTGYQLCGQSGGRLPVFTLQLVSRCFPLLPPTDQKHCGFFLFRIHQSTTRPPFPTMKQRMPVGATSGRSKNGQGTATLGAGQPWAGDGDRGAW